MVSPGFEINDVGFPARRPPGIRAGRDLQRAPAGQIFREWKSTSYVNRATNFDGELIDYFYWTSLSVTHLSYWQVNGSV